MATLRERSPGVWQVRVFSGRDGTGRPTQVAVTVQGTKRDALREAAKLESAPHRGAAGRTVADVLQAWLEHHEGSWAAASLRDQTSRVRHIEADPIAKMAIARLGVADVDRWLTRMRKAGVGQSAVRNRLVVLRAALHQAQVWGWVTANPAALTRAPRLKQAPRDAMSPEEVIAVIKAAAGMDPLAGLALRVAVVAGARRAEIAALRWDDLKGSVLTVDSAVTTLRADGVTTLIDSPTKTGERHTVTLDRNTVRLWGELRPEYEEFGPYVCGLGETPPNPDRIGWWWSRARALSGIAKNWRLHDMRHFSATTAIGDGFDARTVAHRLGHANPAMTLRVYAHAVKAADRAVAESIGRTLAGDGSLDSNPEHAD
jgi:integrase